MNHAGIIEKDFLYSFILTPDYSKTKSQYDAFLFALSPHTASLIVMEHPVLTSGSHAEGSVSRFLSSVWQD